MSRKPLTLLLIAGALLGAAATVVSAAESPSANLKYRAIAPGLAVGEALPTATPTPLPTPTPYVGPVSSLYLQSARLGTEWPVEIRDTTTVGGRETFQDPSGPQWIAWYARFGHPGFGGANSIFAAHINYINFGNGPFAYLMSAAPQDALYVTMANGASYAYTVESVQLVSLAELQAGAIDGYVFPALDAHTERITLISCGGDFVPRAGGGGDYTSRVILIAERYVP